MDKYSQIIKREIEKNLDFQEAIQIAKLCSEKGKILLVGGQIFRTLISQIYGIKIEKKFDFDFLVENPKPITDIKIPKDWKLSKTGFDEPRLINGNKQIDIFGFDNSINPYKKLNISDMNTDEKIDSYFSKVPLNIQKIGYDIDKELVIGDGVKAIENKIIEINCLEEAQRYSKRHNLTVNEFLETKVDYGIFKKIYLDSNK